MLLRLGFNTWRLYDRTKEGINSSQGVPKTNSPTQTANWYDKNSVWSAVGKFCAGNYNQQIWLAETGGISFFVVFFNQSFYFQKM